MKQGWIQVEDNGTQEPLAPKTMADMVYMDETESRTVKDALGGFGGSEAGVGINCNFLNPIVQRGTSFPAGTTQIYTIDRWMRAEGSVSLKVEYAGGLRLTAGAGTGYARLQQYVDDYIHISGGPMTLSANIDGVVYSVTGMLSTTPVSLNTPKGTIWFGVRPTNASHIGFGVDTSAGKMQTVQWIKLEPGASATPFIPRPYSMEYSLCLRYYSLFFYYTQFFGYTWISPQSVFVIPTSIPMRVAPSLVGINPSAWSVRFNNGSVMPATNLAINHAVHTQISLLASHGHTTGAVNSPSVLSITGSGAQGGLDAEIY